MSRRTDLLTQCLLGKRWQATQSTVGATVSVASPALSDGTSRTHLDVLWYSFRNLAGAGGANSTVQLQVRNASPAGTVIAAVDHLIAPSSTSNVSIANVHLFSKRGAGLVVTTDTFVASVAASINAAGWIEDTNG